MEQVYMRHNSNILNKNSMKETGENTERKAGPEQHMSLMAAGRSWWRHLQCKGCVFSKEKESYV